jgi:malate dehydrogenase (oxaloacetate-decarboxylating)
VPGAADEAQLVPGAADEAQLVPGAADEAQLVPGAADEHLEVSEPEPSVVSEAEPAAAPEADSPALPEDVEAAPGDAVAAVATFTPVRTRWVAADGAWETTLRGRQLMNDAHLFRGVAFTEEERRELGLVGLLPPQVISMHEQLTRALGQYHAQPTNLAKNVYLSLLQDRNEVLFFRLLTDHLTEMMPVVYTPTVGEAISHFSQEYRRPRGVFLSVDRPGDIEQSLNATGLGADDVDLIVATDGEAILGIGDWGVGGINISLGKLALYTAAGGIDPGRAIAVMLDVGTNRSSLLEDPLYLGNRHPRVDEDTYDAFIDTFVETASRLFPNALLHWEDLAARNARRVMKRWRDNAFTFNDDMQGTGAVALAAILSGLKRSRGRLADQHVVIFGAGTAGVGIAEQLRDALISDGLDEEEARRRFWLIGRHGLLLESLNVAMHDHQRPWARRDEEIADWTIEEPGTVTLNDVIRNVKATILIGTSGQPGAFTENMIRNMALGCQNPIILPLSNPTELVEAEPWDIMQWTGGRALVATGSAFDPVTYAWSTHYIGQANNAFVFPGLGLGATLVGAIQVTDHMLFAAAEAVSAQVDTTIEGAPLLPEIDALHSTSAAVALAVAQAALEDGVARWALPDPPEAGIEAAMWRPEYRPVRAV